MFILCGCWEDIQGCFCIDLIIAYYGYLIAWSEKPNISSTILAAATISPHVLHVEKRKGHVGWMLQAKKYSRGMQQQRKKSFKK